MLGHQHGSGQVYSNDSVPHIFCHCTGRLKSINDSCVVDNDVDVLELALCLFKRCCYALRIRDIAINSYGSLSFVSSLERSDEIRVDIANNDVRTSSVASGNVSASP